MNESERVLFESTGEILSSLCFLIPCERPPAATGSEKTSVAVAFSGAFAGTLTLTLDGASPRILAEEVEAGDDDASDGIDVFGEVANVVCGRVLTDLFGHDVVFDLAAPRPVADPDPAGAVARTTVFLDHATIDVTLEVEPAGVALLPKAAQ